MQTPLKKETASETKRLFVFNPEHDLALGVGQGSYTPPTEIIKIRKEFSLLPSSFAGDSDFILIPDSLSEKEITSLPYYNETQKKKIIIIKSEDLISVTDKISKIYPWGWDHAIINDLLKSGIPEYMVPSEEEIKNIRILSHRRTTISFREKLAEILTSPLINLPVELKTLREVERLLECKEILYLKAPWSSSGRGIIVSDHITHKGLLEWCHGIIKKQGSVMAEPAWDRVFDFASEWFIKDHKATFVGYSVFKTSSRGKYHGNINDSQEIIRTLIKKSTPEFDENVIKAQQQVIDKIISPFYEGPLGIDMLSDSEGRINPCVEINLRFTMGHIPLLNNVI